MPRPSGLQVVVAALAGRAVARVAGWAVVAGGVVVIAGCTGAESFDAGVLHKGDLTVRVGPVPAAWRPVHIDGADLAWRDDPRGGSALLDVRCSGKDDDAPLSVLTEHLIMGTTERDFTSEETIPFDGREARHTLMRAKLDGVPMYYDLYVMKKDGCVYDLVYVAPPADFTAGAAAFDGFARGLHGSSSAR
ncbi:MAG TPA: hypothetical protein VGG39_31720 [Polyangiaceae bacterium]|jgi:hypothetical protein